MSDPATSGDDYEPGFLARSRLRRRLRHLERLKELALRDLGGLMFELHRADSSNQGLVAGKLKELTATDDALQALRSTLSQSSNSIELREAGIISCQDCGEIVASDANFCSHCGTTLRS